MTSLDVSTDAKNAAKRRIVAIGASAGGLEPFEKFFDHMRTDSDCSFVVIQHLSPDFRSMMGELLNRHSTMPIRQAETGLTVEPNTIYLNPARVNMELRDGQFVLTPVESRDTLHLPIDVFMKSLAMEEGENSVAIILSGTGSDGTKGVEAIRRAGGKVLIQHPDSAKFGGMPSAAINKLTPDAIATPDKLADLVSRLSRGEPIDKWTDDDGEKPVVAADVAPETRVFEVLHERFGIDFSHYKSATIQRRLTRRVELLQLDSLARYVEKLPANRNEAEELFAEFLIDVTSFFRDTPAFDILKRKVVAPLVKSMSAARPIRVWVPGCSSGQEAYSIAITLAEEARRQNVDPFIKIIATDLHQRSVDTARFGVYSAEDMVPIPEELRTRYFKGTGSNWQVRPFLRQMLAFSTHNILTDPPFTRIDLVSCRNLLIYLKEPAQNKAIAHFHFSLVKDGFLLLGPSETVGDLSKEFDMIDQKWRLFSKKRDVRLAEAMAQLPHGGRGTTSRPSPASRISSDPSNARRVYDRSLDVVLKRYAPPGFLLKHTGEVMRIFGDASRYVAVAEGDFSQRIEGLLRPDLRTVVSAALDRAKIPKTLPFERKLFLKEDEDERSYLTVRLEALNDREGDTEQFLLTISEENRGPALTAMAPLIEETSDLETVALLRQRVEDLELLLTGAEETLQTTVEELETSNEELQATNEELMASNEELQSTNEELHSVNEELYIVSAEHQRKIAELIELSSDMEHLLQSTGIGTIFVDEELCVRRFTPAATQTFNLVDHDIGRPIDHITTRFEDNGLSQKLPHIIETGTGIEQEVAANGSIMLLRALPYSAEGSDVAGAVITMVDVSDLKRAQTDAQDLAVYYESIVQDIDNFMLRWNASDGTVTFCNDAFGHLTGRTRDDIIGSQISDVISPRQATSLMEKAESLTPGQATQFLLEENESSGRPTCYEGVVRAIGDADDPLTEYQAVGQDVTETTAYRVALEKLSQLTFDIDKSLEPSIRNALDIGTEFFAMPLGVFSRIEGERYTIEVVVGGDTLGVEAGTVLSLRNTFCFGNETRSQPLAVGSISNSDLKNNDAHNASGLEAYVGQKVNVGTEIFGAVNFAARIARPDFSELEISFINILAEWIGRRVERDGLMKDVGRTRDDLNLLLNSVRAKVFYKDDMNRILRLNEMAASSMGMTVQEATGADTYDLFPEMAEKYHQDDLKVIESGEPLLRIVEKFTPKNAPQAWVETDKIPYQDDGTGSRHLLVVARDITQEKEREEQIRDLNLELSRKNERLETSNDSLKQFAHVASHDLQEPLRKLMQFSEYLAEDCGDELSDDGKFFVEVISGSAARMRNLVTDILALSGATGKEMEHEPLDVPAIIADLQSQMDMRISEVEAQFEIGDLPGVNGDRTLVEQLFRNLLSNALKYKLPEVAPLVQISGGQEQDGTRYIKVTDNGIGMAQKDADGIFEPFKRLHNRDKFDGTGIGLAICHTVCERHGWYIGVKSALGEGTTFTVRMPLQPGDSP